MNAYPPYPSRRKRGEKGEVVETIEDVIVRKLTAERIEELKRLIRDTQEKHRLVKVETVNIMFERNMKDKYQFTYTNSCKGRIITHCGELM